MQKITLKEFFKRFYMKYDYELPSYTDAAKKSIWFGQHYYPFKRKERKYVTIISYFLILASFALLFIPIKNNFIWFVIIEVGLILWIEYIIEFNVFKIIILYLLYLKKESALIELVAKVCLYDEDGLEFLSNFRGVIKSNFLQINEHLLNSFYIGGAYKKTHIKIKFNYHRILIIFDKKKYKLNNSFRNENEILQGIFNFLREI